MFDGLTDTLVSLALTVINVLPASPFRPVIDSFNDSQIHIFLSYVNYLLPVAEMISILSIWIVGVAAYYIYQLILRWIKVIN